MKKILCFFALCCFSVPLWSQFECKLAELGLKGKVSSVIEKECQVTNANYNDQKEIRRAAFVFNPNGCKMEEEYTNPLGEVSYHCAYKYSATGELLEEKVRNSYDKNFIRTYNWDLLRVNVDIQYGTETPMLCAKYSLDSKYNITQRTDFDNGGTFRIFRYNYDPRGLLQSETQQMQGSLNLFFKYTYNSKGLVDKKIETNNAGKIIHTVVYEYDNKGNIMSEIASYSDDPNKLTLTYKYVYDSTGNWIEKQEFMDNNLYSVIKREVSYY